MRVYDLPGSASSRRVILGPLALAISQGDPTRCRSSATDGTIRHAAPGSASPTAADQSTEFPANDRADGHVLGWSHFAVTVATDHIGR
jgi:hypothetical protein